MNKFYSVIRQLIIVLVLALAGFKGIAQTCPPNIDFEFGDFTNWQCYIGNVTSSGSAGSPPCPTTNTINATPSAPITARHTIIPNAPGLNDPFGNFPMTPDGNTVARLGFTGQIGAQIERLSYTFTIPSNVTNYSLTYKYAVIYQDPNHCTKAQPHFEAKVFDVTKGQYINCASFEYFASPGTNGFQVSPNTTQGLVYYKPWTPVTFILSDYIGHNIRIEFTNADCTAGGHWAYCYVDVVNACSSPVVGGNFCPGDPSVSLTAPYSYQSYNWFNVGFGTPIATTQTLTITPPPAVQTQYAVEVIPVPGFGCKDTIFATVKPYPVVPVNAGVDRLICNSANNQIPSVLGTPYQPGYYYSWSPPAGLSDTSIAQPLVTPTASTDYILTVTDSVTGCKNRDTVAIAVAAPVSGSFTINSPNQCLLGNSYQFTSSSTNPTGTTYNWVFQGGVANSNQANPTITYTNGGTYTVKLTATGPSGCIDTTTQTVVVTASPLANAGVDKFLCGGTGSSVAIGAPTVAGNTYSWSPSAGLNDATLAQPTASPSATTNYILTVTGPTGCVSKDTVTVSVASAITGVFTVNNASQCLTGNNFQFNINNPTGLVYNWDFGVPGGYSSQQNPTYTYATPGAYTVKVVVTSPGGTCSDSSTQTVTINAMPVADAGADKLLCGGTGSSTVIGTPALTGYTYSWSPSAGLNDATSAQPTASPTATTDYILTVTGAGGCIMKDTVKVTVTQALSSGFTVNNATQCITGNNFQFTVGNPVAGLTYLWNFGVTPGTNSTQQNPSYSYATAGTYTVKVNLLSSSGCSDSSQKTVTVNDLPVASISTLRSVICEGTPVVLTATGTPATTYKWYKDGVLVGTTNTPSYNATQAGVYTFTLDNGCSNNGTGSVTLTLTKKPAPEFTFTTKCLGFPTPFTDGSTVSGSLPVDYSWNFGGGVTGSTQTSPTITYPNAGTYNVQLTVTPQNCPGLATTVSHPVTIKAPNVNTRYPDKAALENVPLQLTARNIGSTYAWSPGTDLNNAAIMAPIFQGVTENTYTITITDALGCTTVDTQYVKVVKEVNIYMPTAFTPNGDGQNDRIYPFLEGIKQLRMYRIINRWGVIVYETKSDMKGWDGTYKGSPQPMDGYVWEIQAVDYFGKMHSKSGAFTLVR